MKTTGGLLQLFFGMFGVGRFYIGSSDIGTAQVLTYVVGWLIFAMPWIFGMSPYWMVVGWLVFFGLSIWLIIDTIVIFTGKAKDSQGRAVRL